MSQQNQTSCSGGENQKNNNHKTGDHVNFRAADGAVEIVTKTTTAKRYPQHGYPIVCLHLRPQPGCRVQSLNDGSGGVDVLLTHIEFQALALALNEADPKSAYAWREIPEKPAKRKKYWDKINACRRQGHS